MSETTMTKPGCGYGMTYVATQPTAVRPVTVGRPWGPAHSGVHSQSLFISQTLDAVSVYGTYTGTWRTRYNQVRKVCTQEANALAALAALAEPWQDSSRNALSSLSHGRGRRGRRRVRRWP